MTAVDDWKGLLSKLICENMRISGTLILKIFGLPTMHEVEGALSHPEKFTFHPTPGKCNY